MSKESRRIINENKDRRDFWWRESSDTMVFLEHKEFKILEELTENFDADYPGDGI